MWIVLLASEALANPPRIEVFGGWSGSAAQDYAYLTLQPALVRSEDASFVLRSTLHRVRFEAGAPSAGTVVGVSLGPGFVFARGPASVAMAVGVHAQQAAVRDWEGAVDRRIQFDASLEGNALWHPWPQAQLYGVFNFDAGSPYLWARAGATHAVVGLSPSAPVSLRLGAETTSAGTFADRVLELGPVLEVPIRRAGLALSVRGGVAVVGAGEDAAPSFGVGAYWSR